MTYLSEGARVENLASIIIVTYNNRDDLAECLPSMMRQSYSSIEMIVVDNASTDGTAAYVRKHYPSIRLVESRSNLGYAGGNNLGFRHATGEYIVIVNPDTVARDDWLEELIMPLKRDPAIAMTSSKVLLYDQKTHVNTCANHTHYSGLGFCKGLNEPSTDYVGSEEVGAISGCSFAVRRQVYEQLGGFDPDFFMYMEDVDISWRARLAGYRIFSAPSSIIYHKFGLKVHPRKLFFLERNRYLMVLKNYSLKILLLSFPALIITEALTMGYAVVHGPSSVSYKLKAYWWIATHARCIREKHQAAQRDIRITDREFMRMLEWQIPFQQLIKDRLLLKLANGAFNTFYHVFYAIILQSALD